MKIAVCGKGGCGKSTVTSLLAKALARRGKEILVIDSDESNYGLHRQLGMKLPRDFTDYFGGKQNVLNDMMLSKFTHQFFEETWTIDDIPEDYYSLKDGVKLMTSGKIHQANEGCSCAMGTVMTQFIQNLRLTEDQFALMDMEAGIEHFGRGIDNGVDLILIIIDPSYESLQLSKKIGELSESIQKHLVRFDIFDIVKQTGQVDRKEIREHWENAKLSFWEQRKCMKKVMNMEKVLGEWFVVFQNAVSYLAEKGVMNQSPLVQSDYELFSCESKNLGKKLKRYCEILSNASDYIMGEEK